MHTIWTDILGSEVRYRGNRFRTRTLEAGSGFPLLLLHGIGGHAEAFSRNIERLSQHFHVIAMDFVWHGFSSKPNVPREMHPVYMEQVLDLMDDLGYDQVSIEGESLGAWIAMRLALQEPQRIHKLVLNTAYGVRFKADAVKEDEKGGLEQLRERSIAAVTNPTREVVRKRLEWLMASPEKVTDELVEIRYKMYRMPETQVALKAVFQTNFSADRADKLIEEERVSEITAPTLVLWTDKNPGLGPDAGKYLSQLIPGAEFYCIEDSAHWPQWEQAEQHDRVVLDFLLK